jgi:hypothetical protein
MTTAIANYLWPAMKHFFHQGFEIVFGLLICLPGYLLNRMFRAEKPDVNSVKVWGAGCFFWAALVILIRGLSQLFE